MTDQGESMMQKEEIKNIGLRAIKESAIIRYSSDFLGKEKDKIIEERDECRKGGIEGSSYEFISGGMHIWYGNVNSSKRIRTNLEVVSPHIHMLFSIRSTSSYNFESDNSPTFKFGDQEHNILLLPNECVCIESKPSSQIESLSINLCPDLFFSYFPSTVSFFSGFRKSIKKKIPSRLSKQNLPITPKINSLLYDIVHCSLNGYSKRLYIEAKVIELLAIQLDQFEQVETEPLYANLKKEAVDKMQQVQQIITNNPEKTFSLKDLSRQVGTNENNLKKHFKQVFGNTVFGYIQNFRMEKAKEMLADGNTKISEVGRQLGYKHATHFTTAFKKYFGFLPHKIKALLLMDLFEFDLTMFFEFI